MKSLKCKRKNEMVWCSSSCMTTWYKMADWYTVFLVMIKVVYPFLWNPFITGKPIITLPFTVVETVKGHLLSCTALGTPPIQVKLFKDNILLASGKSSIHFRLNESATYTCLANNSFGTDYRDFQVTLLGKCSTDPYWTNTEPL